MGILSWVVFPAVTPVYGSDPLRAGLTARETEVLRELARGARNNEIAQALGITERTVKSHLKSLYQKLGFDSRSAAVSKALRDGLV